MKTTKTAIRHIALGGACRLPAAKTSFSRETRRAPAVKKIALGGACRLPVAR